MDANVLFSWRDSSVTFYLFNAVSCENQCIYIFINHNFHTGNVICILNSEPEPATATTLQLFWYTTQYGYYIICPHLPWLESWLDSLSILVSKLLTGPYMTLMTKQIYLLSNLSQDYSCSVYVHRQKLYILFWVKASLQFGCVACFQVIQLHTPCSLCMLLTCLLPVDKLEKMEVKPKPIAL